MAPPISVEVRKRVVAAHREGKGTYAELADVFQVGEASVSRWLRLERETGSLQPKPKPGRAPKLDEHGRGVLRELVEANNDATLAELASQLQARLGVTLVVSAVHKVLVKMGISRKKKTSMRASVIAKTSSFEVALSARRAGRHPGSAAVLRREWDQPLDDPTLRARSPR